MFYIALLPRTCQVQKCTFTPRRSKCNCNAEHSGRGTCSRSLSGGQRGIRTCDPPDERHLTLPLGHHAHAPLTYSLNIIISCISRKKKHSIHLTRRPMQENAEEVCLPPREKVQNRSLYSHH